jgi:hypothetical protein
MKSPVWAWMRCRMWLSVRPGAIVTRWSGSLLAGLVDEHDAGRAHHDLVAVGEVVLADPLAAHERAVERPQVAQQEPPIAGALDLRVLLRDDPIEDLDRVVRGAGRGVERRKLELLALFPEMTISLAMLNPERRSMLCRQVDAAK